MSFVYTPGIPSGTDIPAQSAPLFAANFSYMNVMENRDHFMTLNSANSNDGTHRQVTLTNQAAPGFTGGNGVFYGQSKNGDSFPKWQNTAGSKFFFSVTPQMANNGYTGLPGTTDGLMIQWGRVATTGGSGTVTFATANISFNASCYAVVATPLYTGSAPTSSSGNYVSINQSTLSNTKFDWKANFSSGNLNGFFWIAIGE